MSFVDHVRIHASAGDGGAGSVSFRREKFVPLGGPDGGDGGKGGNVVFIASSQLQTLLDLKIQSRYAAKNGTQGAGRNCSGLAGHDLVVRVPVGTLVFADAWDSRDHQASKLDDDGFELDWKDEVDASPMAQADPGTLLVDLIEDGQIYVLARGGKGGKGNTRFATAVNRTPRYAQPGIPGESGWFRIELRVIAEVGLVGLPNAGKSTLLSVLTAANPKIAAYPFTTLYPNLGVLKQLDREVVIADIPGLIEGASEGKGLGIEFLRHIDRTKVLVHLISLEIGDPESAWRDYRVVRQELDASPFRLHERPSIVALTKTDTISEYVLAEIVAYFEAKDVPVLAISAVARHGLEPLAHRLFAATQAAEVI